MANSIRTIRQQCLRNSNIIKPASIVTPARRHNSSHSNLQHEMRQRHITPTFDDLSPGNSYRLEATLADFLPKTTTPPPALLPPTHPPRELPIAHHLLYFEPSKRASEMLPDGTNPDHAPPGPFPRRMWAGGRVRYNNDNMLQLDGGRAVCAEFIRDVVVKGKEGDEKVFVSIERRLAKASEDEVGQLSEGAAEGGQKKKDLEHRVRQRLWRDDEEDFGECSILDTRSIVFMRARSQEELQAAKKAAKEGGGSGGGKILKPELKPDYTHTIVPDPKLLFRFSALTFNAHSIHLDPRYTLEEEGHRERLFHGPLSFMFIMTLLQQQLSQLGNHVVKSVEYRNLAPLYCFEPVKFCGGKAGPNKWEVWAETPEGGIAVKGKVVTEEGRIDKSNLGL